MKNSFLSLLFLSVTLVSCQKTDKKATEPVSIKSLYADDFLIGAALNTSQITEADPEQSALIELEFNTSTAENMMKSMNIHPSKDSFNFDMADKLVALGDKYGMGIHGHTLIWHSQLSEFFNEIKDSTEMVNAMTHHISTIAGRYKGKLISWDVVNEAIENDGSLRKSHFHNVLGKGYLPLSFKLAQAADSEADLYYNDYNMTYPEKRAGVINLVKEIQNSGAKIDGIGMQAHWGLDSPTLEEIETSILAYADLGVKVAITELDIDVLPWPKSIEGAEISQHAKIDAFNNPYINGLPDSVNVLAAKRYAEIFKLFSKHKEVISRVTFWGVNDGDSWKNNWPAEGRTNYPLIFDRENKRKPAYDSIMALKSTKE